MSTESSQPQDMKVGEILRRARVHYNQSIPDVERILRIRASQIEAIESGDFKKLPGRVYAIGFIRSYAEYLGLNGDKMVELFKEQANIGEVKQEYHFPALGVENKVPSFKLATVFLVIGALLIALWWGIPAGQETQGREEIPPIPELAAPVKKPEVQKGAASASGKTPEEAASAEKAGPQMPPPDPEPASSEEDKASKGIILSMQENSWVEIKDKDGKAIVAKILKAGETYYVPDRPDLRMSLGNSGGIEITVDGVRLKPLGEQSEVRRNIPLDADYLKKNYAAPAKNP